MAKANPSAEPSMEEILASIRRIISDDGEEAAKPSVSPPPLAAVPSAAAPAVAALIAEADEADAADEGVSENAPEDLSAGAEPVEDELEEADAVEPIVVQDPNGYDVEIILELDESMADEPVDADSNHGVDPVDASPAPEGPSPKAPTSGQSAAVETDTGALDEPAEPAPPPSPPKAEQHPDPSPARASGPEPEPLISSTTSASVNAAFGQLTHTILSANAKTLDDLVKEMLRPMLKGWLDENLPSVVERLVRAEIERVSRGR